MRQYLLEIEYRVIVESECEDAEEVGENFVAQLAELAASNDHILGMQINAYPLPEIRRAQT